MCLHAQQTANLHIVYIIAGNAMCNPLVVDRLNGYAVTELPYCISYGHCCIGVAGLAKLGATGVPHTGQQPVTYRLYFEASPEPNTTPFLLM